ncbi:MAG: hypothetical protein NTZ61_06515 [Proteobacteria bacterium]|nr:hypothetical protein [Pseudomonadota bacterium]
MKLRHPLTGAFDALQDDGPLRAEQDGRTGLFDLDGRWHAGALHDTDPQMIQWVGWPQMGSRGPFGGGRNAAAPPSRS